jgi:hypothetical protein
MAVLPQLVTLNECVTISARTKELTGDFFMCFNLAVFTELHPESENRRVTAFCHANQIELILAQTRRVFGSFFVDLGNQHLRENTLEKNRVDFFWLSFQKTKRQP